MSMEIEGTEVASRHREMIHQAEISRLSGEPTCTPEEMHERIEALFNAYEK